MRDSFLYLIENTLNNKVYIGVSVDPKQRWMAHKSIAKTLTNAHHLHYAMAQHFDKLESVFNFTIIQNFSSEEEAYQAEKFWIKTLKEAGVILYNETEGGEHGPVMFGEDNPFFGKTHSEETRKILSEKITGIFAGDKNYFYDKHFFGEEHALFNSQRPENVKNALSKAHSGKVLSEETKKKQSERRKGLLIGDKNPMFGIRGEKHLNSKISDKLAIEIYDLYASKSIKRKDLDKLYPEISKSTISRVIYAFDRFEWLASEEKRPPELSASKKIITEEIYLEAKSLYDKGMNYRQIAEKFDLNVKTLINAFHRFSK